MSKIGKQIINLPTGVTLEAADGVVKVKGLKGTLELKLPRKIEINVKDNQIEVLRKGENKNVISLHGTIRSLINSMVLGVSSGFSKSLELVGTGFRSEVSGKNINLIVGYSHPVKIELPEGVTARVEKNVITIDGVDKQLVGQVAANIRAVRPPEPYKGKGIKYTDEIIRRKPGKAAAKTTGA